MLLQFKLIYGPFGKSNMHLISAPAQPRLARKKINVPLQLHNRRLRAYCPDIYTVPWDLQRPLCHDVSMEYVLLWGYHTDPFLWTWKNGCWFRLHSGWPAKKPISFNCFFSIRKKKYFTKDILLFCIKKLCISYLRRFYFASCLQKKTIQSIFVGFSEFEIG